MSDKPILVVWRDAFFQFDEEEDERADYLVETVGWVLKDGPKFLVLAQERLPDGDGWRAITHIPLDIIESRKEFA